MNIQLTMDSDAPISAFFLMSRANVVRVAPLTMNNPPSSDGQEKATASTHSRAVAPQSPAETTDDLASRQQHEHLSASAVVQAA